MTTTLTIDGDRIDGIASFYAEINRVFMADEEWTLGPSLDALDDMLSGNYGALAGREVVRLIWRDIARSQSALGLETTRAFLREKLRWPDVFNADLVGRQLDELEGGVGRTYFDIIIAIIADHPNIELVAG